MLVDNVVDVGAPPYPRIVIRTGATFPVAPVTGQLFIHNTHGFCVYGHDQRWRKIQR